MIEPEVVFQSNDQILVRYYARLKFDALIVLMLEKPWKSHRQKLQCCREKENLDNSSSNKCDCALQQDRIYRSCSSRLSRGMRTAKMSGAASNVLPTRTNS